MTEVLIFKLLEPDPVCDGLVDVLLVGAAVMIEPADAMVL